MHDNPAGRQYPDGSRVTFAYDANGNRTLKENGDITVTMVYDALKRPTSVTSDMNGAKKTIGYAFDAVGNRSRMTDPDGGRFTYVYDAASRITSLRNPQDDRTTFSYDNANRRTVTRLANGTRASFSYDDTDRLTRLANIKSDGTTISSFDYQYDSANRRTVSLENDGSRVTWTYDNDSQLLVDHRTGTTAYRNTFTYDPNGNRLLKNESGTRTTYSYDAADQLITGIDPIGTTTYAFDADGNQQLVVDPTGGRTTTTWDYENRTSLILLPGATRNTMLYEPGGLRIQLADAQGEKNFLWDNENYLAELDNSNITTALYTNEPQQYGNLISQRRGTTTKWYHYEALGSTRELTDASETVTDTYLYDAWGNILTSTGTTVNPFRYVGQLGYYFDPDTGRYYIRARIYNPVTARWTSTDPLLFADGENMYRPFFVPADLDPSGTVVVGVYTCIGPCAPNPLCPLLTDVFGCTLVPGTCRVISSILGTKVCPPALVVTFPPPPFCPPAGALIPAVTY